MHFCTEQGSTATSEYPVSAVDISLDLRKVFRGSQVYKWELEMICAAEGLKKICREYPSFSLCAECSLGLLQLFLALGNQNSWKFFFPETGVVFGHLECLDVYIFFLGKLLFIQRVLGPGNHYHRRELRVHPGWVLRVPWKNTSVVLVGAARPLQ